MSAQDRLDVLENLEWHLKKCLEGYRDLGMANQAGQMEDLLDEVSDKADEAQHEADEEIKAEIQELNDYYFSTRM